METYEYVITRDGRSFRRQSLEVPINITDIVLRNLGSQVPHKTHPLFMLRDWGQTSLTTIGEVKYFTIEINRIPMTTKFRLLDGIFVPQFAGTATDTQMTLTWTPPESMRLKILAQVHNGALVVAYLFAYDRNNVAWRLPLANLFEDCKLCLGEFVSSANTHEGILLKTMEQFAKSDWNKDLWSDENKTRQMFRWKPLEEGFECLAPNEPVWSRLCVKVAVSAMQYVL